MSASFDARPFNCAVTPPFASTLSASPLVDMILHILSAVFAIRSSAFSCASRLSAWAISCVTGVAATTSPKRKVRANEDSFPDKCYPYCITQAPTPGNARHLPTHWPIRFYQLLRANAMPTPSTTAGSSAHDMWRHGARRLKNGIAGQRRAPR